MYGNQDQKAHTRANCRDQADARSGGSTPQSDKKEGSEKEPIKETAEDVSRRLSDAKSKASEEHTAKESSQAEELTSRAGFKRNKIDRPQYPTAK